MAPPIAHIANITPGLTLLELRRVSIQPMCSLTYTLRGALNRATHESVAGKSRLVLHRHRQHYYAGFGGHRKHESSMRGQQGCRYASQSAYFRANQPSSLAICKTHKTALRFQTRLVRPLSAGRIRWGNTAPASDQRDWQTRRDLGKRVLSKSDNDNLAWSLDRSHADQPRPSAAARATVGTACIS